MKKSSFVAILLGTVSMMLFALGMCMALIPEWEAFQPGVIFGCVGLALGLVTVVVWRRMEHKEPIHISGKMVLTAAVAVIGALTLGVGMCMCMVWGRMAAGIVILLCLIPLVRGIKA